MNSFCHGKVCCCEICHAMRLDLYSSQLPDTLQNELVKAGERETDASKAAFIEVLNQMAMCKAFRLQIYALHKYKSTAPYLKQVKGYSKNDAKAFAAKINGGSRVFDRFKDILRNLKHCKFIAIYKLTLNQLVQAINPRWCLICNEALREKVGTSAPDSHNGYSEEDFRDLISTIKVHPAYRSIDKRASNNYGRKEVAALMHRVQKNLL